MKKYVSIFVMLLCLLLLAACSENPKSAMGSTTSTTIVIESSETTELETETEDMTAEIPSTETTAFITSTGSSTAATQRTVASVVSRSSSATTTTARRATNATKPSAKASTTVKPNTAVRPAITTTAPTTQEYEVVPQIYIDAVLRGLNNERALRDIAPMRLDAALNADCTEQAWRMARAGKTFHSEFPTGCESVGCFPYNYPGETMGSMLAMHVQNFIESEYFLAGIAVVRRGDQLYAVMQGTR